MSYRIYSTRGFTLGSAPSGETSKTYLIYTEDFGLIRARAQGVRLLASKLRYNLSDYSFLTLSLVRGKEFWRITGAVSDGSLEQSGKTDSLGISAALMAARARVLIAVRRLVQGEERNDYLFNALGSLFGEEVSSLTDGDDVLALETLAMMRILSVLGYLDLVANLPSNSLAEAKTRRRELIHTINKSLQESHL